MPVQLQLYAKREREGVNWVSRVRRVGDGGGKQLLHREAVSRHVTSD